MCWIPSLSVLPCYSCMIYCRFVRIYALSDPTCFACIGYTLIHQCVVCVPDMYVCIPQVSFPRFAFHCACISTRHSFHVDTPCGGSTAFLHAPHPINSYSTRCVVQPDAWHYSLTRAVWELFPATLNILLETQQWCPGRECQLLLHLHVFALTECLSYCVYSL